MRFDRSAAFWPFKTCWHYVHQHIEAIRSDKILRHYGVAMAAIHLLTAVWLFTSKAARIIAADSEPICWPFLKECEALRIFSTHQLHWLFAIYGAASLLVAGLFLRRHLVGFAYSGLIITTIIKFAIVLIDYRLRLNQHYMGLVITLVYLFVPHKRVALPWMIVFFYFWAGTIKLNWAWISGQGLEHRLPIFAGPWLVAACTYVLVLELVVVWGLLLKNRILFGFCFFQFAVFHIISWWVVGYFYPLLMFSILSIFLLERFHHDISPKWPRPQALVVNFIFSLLQLIPYAFPGNTHSTGEGRFLSLHMFDAPHRCEVYAVLKTSEEQSVAKNLKLTSSYRISCDPEVYYHRAKYLCRQRVRAPLPFSNFDLVMFEGPQQKTLVKIDNFCSQNIEYHAFRHNDWIEIY